MGYDSIPISVPLIILIIAIPIGLSCLPMNNWVFTDNKYAKYFVQFEKEDAAWHKKWKRRTIAFCHRFDAFIHPRCRICFRYCDSPVLDSICTLNGIAFCIGGAVTGSQFGGTKFNNEPQTKPIFLHSFSFFQVHYEFQAIQLLFKRIPLYYLVSRYKGLQYHR